MSHNPGLIKTYTAGGAIAASRIVKFGADDRTVVRAAAAGDALVGVSERLAVAADERVDVIRSGLATVRYGGAVTRGDLLTADASGRAVTTTTANSRVIGIAEVSGVSGDLGAVLICPSRI